MLFSPKALEVMLNPNNFELRDFINFQMGGFHASCIFLAVIGKRFGSAGIRDLIVEAGLTGPDSVERILMGKHYNRGIRIANLYTLSVQTLSALIDEIFKR